MYVGFFSFIGQNRYPPRKANTVAGHGQLKFHPAGYDRENNERINSIFETEPHNYVIELLVFLTLVKLQSKQKTKKKQFMTEIKLVSDVVNFKIKFKC
ncbi:hypothetical protein TorRG33x02_278340 [Trema orientale]|uniref:Uncharacterized protein n=1 Tax=Trema orientale TaxID=63057 RepID=A0A2P5CNR8_TREOI|nr:hypothetical protein TorRG33x02_278340 [Trema orientale]